ncbi:hypothetical protein BJ138DRAFT_1007307 [Hygrophoropsis aurantiaca]|uniref:Uncharacterized protein n=1 Tax=Hygrophoropsis aurantiaca TaxID=72124 RepID=A0ACB8ADJ5_9AGAM|nr:hypothetical protein BJ138DRAFT_1007307 [Hygrophoropsis aurantiaca]
MDYSDALITPSILRHASTTLEFERDVMTSTTITVRGEDAPRYSIKSRRAGALTPRLRTVVSEGDRVIVTIGRRDILPDQLIWEGSPPINISSWLKFPVMAQFPVAFEEAGKRYHWRGDRSTGDIQLHIENLSEPIAWFHPTHVVVDPTKDSNYTRRPASLSLTSEAETMREKVLLSCILVLQRTRTKERAQELRRERASQPMFTAGFAVGLGM